MVAVYRTLSPCGKYEILCRWRNSKMFQTAHFLYDWGNIISRNITLINDIKD